MPQANVHLRCVPHPYTMEIKWLVYNKLHVLRRLCFLFKGRCTGDVNLAGQLPSMQRIG